MPFFEIYLEPPLNECIRRDVKGMYKRALAGELKNFTGIDDPYEAPENPDLAMNTEVMTIEESLFKIKTLIRQNGFLKSKLLDLHVDSEIRPCFDRYLPLLPSIQLDDISK